MRLIFLGTTSNNGNCPTLYATDRGTLVVQGYLVTDPDAREQLRDLLPGESAVEVPRELLRYFAPGAGDGASKEVCDDGLPAGARGARGLAAPAAP